MSGEIKCIFRCSNCTEIFTMSVVSPRDDMYCNCMGLRKRSVKTLSKWGRYRVVLCKDLLDHRSPFLLHLIQ